MMGTIRRPQTIPRDRTLEIKAAYEEILRNLSLGISVIGAAPFTLASLKSTKNGQSVSASDDFKDILSDIQLIRLEVEKYDGPRTPSSDTLYEAATRLKFKLDSPKFDEDDFRSKRKQNLYEIDEILNSLALKIKN